MEGKKVCKTLPDHLVERIISMIPFPAIFQAWCLSRSWYARFCSISEDDYSISEDGEEIEHVGRPFQKLLSERSKSWEIFCPVFICMNGDLVAYDKQTHNWQNMPTVSFLQELVHREFDLRIEGALLYASDFGCFEEIYVANILTGDWKRLPLPPASGCRLYASKLVVTDRSSQTYKVILFCQRDMYANDFLFVQIYDSKAGSWSWMKLDFKLPCDPSHRPGDFNSVHLDGVCYIATAWDATNLFAFNVRDGTFKGWKLSCPTLVGRDYYSQLVVFKDELLMVVAEGRNSTSPSVLKIDLDSLTVMNQSSDDPPYLGALESSFRATAPIGDEEHIFFGYIGNPGSRMRAYNVKADLWSSSLALPMKIGDWDDEYRFTGIGSFQPGLGTFAAA